ncbi:MAG: rhodanese-like domain-containing protein [Chthoniobacterales bacterium]
MSNTIPIVSPHKAREIATGNNSSILLDVRTPSEFSARRALGASNIPLDTLDAITESLPKNAPILLLCEKGGRAAIAATKLQGHGFADVHVIEGGTEAWASSGLPIEGTGRKTISIERQVRIGAGSFVLLGVILGFLLNHAFFGLSAFVGGGLIFAGVTDWCGMGLLLARAPWNK